MVGTGGGVKRWSFGRKVTFTLCFGVFWPPGGPRPSRGPPGGQNPLKHHVNATFLPKLHLFTPPGRVWARSWPKPCTQQMSLKCFHPRTTDRDVRIPTREAP